MIGASFQPGGQRDETSQQASPSQGSGVQDAIKVLSLRLPRVVGAQAAVPQALLQGAGSQGNRVDSVVNQVLSRIFPTGQPQGQPMPTMGANPSAPSQEAPAMPSWPWMPQQQPQRSQPSQQPQQTPWPWTGGGAAPRVVIDNGFNLPPRWPNQPTMDGGGFPNGAIDYLPPDFQPGLPAPMPDVFDFLRRTFSEPPQERREESI